MTSRERVRAALRHEQPDRTPIDLGGCGQTGISASTLYQLRKALGLPEHPIRVCEPYQMIGEVETDVLDAIGADVLPLWNPSGTLMGTSTNLTQPWTMPDGTPVVMSDNFAFDRADTGDIYVYPGGDRTAPYSLHMPAVGYFFDTIPRAQPVDEDNLTPIEDFRDSYQVHTEQTCRLWEQRSIELYQDTDRAVLGVLGGAGLGDAAEIPGPFLAHPKGIRNIEDWLMAHLLFPEYIEQVFTLQTEVMLKNLELYRQAVGDRIEAIWMGGADYGTQNGLFLSAKLFRQLYKPHYQRINDWVHKHTPWKTFYHSCGSVRGLMEDFIEMGVDILNPVQCSAVGMDPS